MARYIAARLGEVLGVMLAVSFLVYLVLEHNVADVAVKVLGQFSTQEQRTLWLHENGYDAPFLQRYVLWLWHFVNGQWGNSSHFREKVIVLLPPYLRQTAILAGLTFAVMLPLSFSLGIAAGVREGSLADRLISLTSVVTTSVPEFASSVFLSAVFVFWLGVLPGASTMISGFSWSEIVLPVLVLVLYDFGYVARMTRASMAEVMSSQYIRTAVLKGLPYRRVILRHALRNALIAPFTIIVLQMNWLLSGVVVVEVFFQYAGFGKLLLDAALFGDIYVIQAATLVAVFVAVLSQIISDVGYTFLNPRIRFA